MGLCDLKIGQKSPETKKKSLPVIINFKIGLRWEEKSGKEPTESRLQKKEQGGQSFLETKKRKKAAGETITTSEDY
jgi:hypothetical protein